MIDAAIRQQARAAILVVAAGNFMVQLAMMPVSTMLPTMAHAFGVEAATAAWVMNAYLLTLTGLVLMGGRLGDQYGHRRVFSLGIVLFALGATLGGLAPSLVVMIAARAIQGIGGALLLSNALALLVMLVPPGERGRAIGLSAVAASLGSLIGVGAGAFLLSAISWRWIFLLVVPAAAYALWETRRLPAAAPRVGRAVRPDIVGAVLLFGLLTTLSLSFTHLHDGAPTSEVGFVYHTGMQVLTGLLLAAFIVSQTRARAPMMPMRQFRNRRFTMAILANCALHMTMMGSIFLVPFLVEQGMGRSVATTGALLLPMQAVSMGASYAGGWLYDRTRSRLIAPLMLVIIGLGLGTIGVLNAGLNEPALIALLALVGASTSIFMSANNTAAMAALPREVAGFAAGTLETSRQLGHTVAVALAGGVLGLVAEQALAGADAANALHGIALAILSFSLVAFVGMAFALFGGEPPRPRAAAATALTAAGADD